MAKVASEIRKVVDDIGIAISASDDAMFVIGRLDALASVIASRFQKSLRVAKPAHEVLRSVAKKQAGERYSKVLRRAASRVAALEQIAKTSSYGELPPDQLRRADEVRSELYELLLEWLKQFEE
jgi:hypothetical protein